jgi:hypothetical protein
MGLAWGCLPVDFIDFIDFPNFSGRETKEPELLPRAGKEIT